MRPGWRKNRGFGSSQGGKIGKSLKEIARAPSSRHAPTVTLGGGKCPDSWRYFPRLLGGSPLSECRNGFADASRALQWARPSRDPPWETAGLGGSAAAWAAREMPGFPRAGPGGTGVGGGFLPGIWDILPLRGTPATRCAKWGRILAGDLGLLPLRETIFLVFYGARGRNRSKPLCIRGVFFGPSAARGRGAGSHAHTKAKSTSHLRKKQAPENARVVGALYNAPSFEKKSGFWLQPGGENWKIP